MSSIIQIKKITCESVDADIKYLLDQINYVNGPVDIDKLLELLDIKKIETRIDVDNVIASLQICEFFKKKYNNPKVVFVDDKYYKEIQDFCIAGVISDYIYNYNNRLSFSSTKGYYVDKSLLSRLSNYFALGLSMPEDVFKEKYYEFKGDTNPTLDGDVIYLLSMYFHVPYMKAEERISNFLKQEAKQKVKIQEYKKI